METEIESKTEMSKAESARSGFFFLVLAILSLIEGYRIIKNLWYQSHWYELVFLIIMIATGSIYASQLLVLLINKLSNKRS